MKKTMTAFLIIIAIILILATSQNSAPISSSQNVDFSIPATSSSTGTPEPKETMTPTLSEAKQTARATNPTKFAFIETYSAGDIKTKTYVADAIISKDLFCPDDYNDAPLYFWEGGIDAYTTADDTWSIISCVPQQDSLSFGYTKLVNQDSSKKQIISYESLGFSAPRLLYLYALEYDKITHEILFTPKINAYLDGGDSFQFSKGYFGLYRYNLDTGLLYEILPYGEKEFYTDIAFNPEKTQLIYQRANAPYIINIINPRTNENIFSIEIDNEIEISGRFFWSETDPIVIYAAGYPGWDNGDNGISIYRLNLNTKTNIELIHNDMRALIPYANDQTGSIWLDKTTITLISIDEETDYWYQMNIQTGEVTKLSVEENK